MLAWYILPDPVVHSRYGSFIWKIVPLTWRPWWLQCIKREFPVIFGDVTLLNPSPIFRDTTTDLKCWNEDINSYLLSRLASTSTNIYVHVLNVPGVVLNLCIRLETYHMI